PTLARPWPRHPSQHDVLGGDAVFVEDAVVKGGIQVHKTTHDRTGAHSYSCHRLARLGQIRISVGKFYTRVDKYNYPHERAKHVFDRTKAYQFHCQISTYFPPGAYIRRFDSVGQ